MVRVTITAIVVTFAFLSQNRTTHLHSWYYCMFRIAESCVIGTLAARYESKKRYETWCDTFTQSLLLLNDEHDSLHVATVANQSQVNGEVISKVAQNYLIYFICSTRGKAINQSKKITNFTVRYDPE
jgi:hypothetical protein